MTLQEIEQAILELDVADLRRVQEMIRARLRELAEEVPYERIAHLAGDAGDASADLSTGAVQLTDSSTEGEG